MRRLVFFLLLAAPVAAVAQTPVQRGWAVSATVSMRVWLPSGRVRLETWDRDSIHVTGTVAKGSNFFGGGGQGSAKVGVEQPDKRANTLARGDLVVTVPRRAQVFIKATDAVIETAHTAGDLELLTVGGRVSVEDARAVVSIETIDAPITIRGATGIVRLHTGGGTVGLFDVTGDLTVSTVRGQVELRSEMIGDARLETVSGGVNFSGRLRPGAFVDIQTHDGKVALILPATAVPQLELSSRGGEVSNGAGPGSVKFGRVVVRSFKGDINVSVRRDVEGGKPRTTP